MSYTTLTEKLMDKANLLKVQFELDPNMSYIEASKLLKHLKKRLKNLKKLLKNLVKRYLKSNRAAYTDIRVKLSYTDAGALSLCINVPWVGLAAEREAATNLLDILRAHILGDESLCSHIQEKAPFVWDWVTDPAPHHQLFKDAIVVNKAATEEIVVNNKGATEETISYSLFVSKSLELRFVVTPTQPYLSAIVLLRNICDVVMKESYGEDCPVEVFIDQAFFDRKVIQIKAQHERSSPSSSLHKRFLTDTALVFLDKFRSALVAVPDSKSFWEQFPSISAWLNDDKSHTDLYDTNELHKKEPVITYQL